jgi:DNA polymerase III psi subunit
MTLKKLLSFFAKSSMNRNFAYSFILFLASSHIHALDEDLFIEKILQSAHLFESAAINLEIKEIELFGDERQYNNWHWDLDGEILLSGRLQDKDTNYTYTHQQIQSNQLLSTELSKRFFSNGSELTLSLSGSLPKTSEEKYKNQSYYSDVVTYASLVDAEISWELPLLRNVDGILDQRTYDIAVLELQDEQLVFREFQESTVASYLKGYFEYAILGNEISLLEAHINQLDLLDTHIREEVPGERLTSYSSRALNKAKSRLTSLIGKQQTLVKKLENVLVASELEAIKPIYYPLKANPLGDVESSSVGLKRIRIEQLKNQRQIHYYQNALKPELDFSINASRVVQKGNYSSYSESDTTDVEVSLSFEYPLSGDIGAKTLLRKYQLKARQLEIKYNNKLEGLKTKQKTLQLRLQIGLEGIDFINNQLSQLDMTAITVEGLRSVDTKSYIDSLEDAVELKLDYNDELIEYQHTRVDYDNLLSRLLVKSL